MRKSDSAKRVRVLFATTSLAKGPQMLDELERAEDIAVVDVACCVTELRSLLVETRPDAVLIDSQMPALAEVLKVIKAGFSPPYVVLLVSDLADVHKVSGLGADCIFPWDANLLIPVLRTLAS
jgi:DNA-binding NarL/FixJ family response regulator